MLLGIPTHVCRLGIGFFLVSALDSLLLQETQDLATGTWQIQAGWCDGDSGSHRVDTLTVTLNVSPSWAGGTQCQTETWGGKLWDSVPYAMECVFLVWPIMLCDNWVLQEVKAFSALKWSLAIPMHSSAQVSDLLDWVFLNDLIFRVFLATASFEDRDSIYADLVFLQHLFGAFSFLLWLMCYFCPSGNICQERGVRLPVKPLSSGVPDNKCLSAFCWSNPLIPGLFSYSNPFWQYNQWKGGRKLEQIMR